MRASTRGDGVALVVNGAALADQAGGGYDAVSAGPGRHLIVFAFSQVRQPDQPPPPPPSSLALVTDGERRSVDLRFLPDNGPFSFAASIPAKTADVDLELSAVGFSQRFSLMTLTRRGPDPVALYRDGDNPAVIDKDSSAVGVAATTGPPDSTNYHLGVGAAVTTISWFAPDAAIHTPASVDQAFLIVQLDVVPDPNEPSSHYLTYPSSVPAAKVHLTLGDGTRVDATHAGDDNATFSGVYYFTVPADIAAAALSVDSYQATGLTGGVFPDKAQLTFSAFTIKLALSKPPAAPPATTASTALKLIHPNSAAAPAPGAANPARHSAQAPLWIVSILLLAAAAVLWAAVRRRRSPAPATANAAPGVDAAPPAFPWAPPAHRGAAAPPTAAPPASPNPWAPPVAATPLAPPIASTRLRAPPSPAVADPPAPPVAAPPLAAPPVPAPAAVGEPSGVTVGLLGAAQVAGPGIAKLRPREFEVFVFLAVNNTRAVTNDDIRAALAGASDDESSATTVRTWLSRIRGAVGAHILPEADNGRYRINDVDTDIARLGKLLAQAAAATDAAEAACLLNDALGLVRGRPFETLDYRWTLLLVANLETAIADAAVQLAELAARADDPATAAWAAQRGLAATVQPDDRLLEQVMAAGAAQGQVPQAWREVTARYAAVGDAPGGDLVATYDRLRNRPDRQDGHRPPTPPAGRDPSRQWNRSAQT